MCRCIVLCSGRHLCNQENGNGKNQSCLTMSLCICHTKLLLHLKTVRNDFTSGFKIFLTLPITRVVFIISLAHSFVLGWHVITILASLFIFSIDSIYVFSDLVSDVFKTLHPPRNIPCLSFIKYWR